MLRTHLGGRELLKTIPPARVALIGLELLLLARELDERGVRHDDESTCVNGRIERGEILRTEFVGGNDGETAQGLILRVDEEPGAVVARVRSTIALLHLLVSFFLCGFVPFVRGFVRGLPVVTGSSPTTIVCALYQKRPSAVNGGKLYARITNASLVLEATVATHPNQNS